jgi:hypothetical protein
MNGIIRCPSCGASVIEEEFAGHKCGLGKPTIRRVVDLAYQWWLKARGDPLIAIMGEDGTLYRFSPVMQNPFKSPEDAREYRLTTLRLNMVEQGRET